MRNLVLFVALSLTGLYGLSVNGGELISYQGRLTDDAGNAVSDGEYSLTFSLWNDSTGGQQQWSEAHAPVSVIDGLFSVILGKDGALEASIFEADPLFLQIQIGPSDIIAPRTRLTSAPSAVKAKKVDGDIQTGAGYLNVNSPDSTRAVSITTEGRGSPAFLRMYNPAPDFPDQALVQLSSESDGGKFNLFPPGDFPQNPAFTIGLEPTPFRPGYLGFFDPTGSLPHDPYVKMGFDPTPFGGYVEFYDPGSGWAHDPMVKMGVEPSPFHTGFIAMYNPELGPPPKLLEIGINDSTEVWTSRFAMYNGVAFPPDPCKLFEIIGTPSAGASLAFYDDIGKVMGLDPSPFNEGFSMYLMDPADNKMLLEISGNHVSGGASIKMATPVPEPPRTLLEISTDPAAGPNMYLATPLPQPPRAVELSVEQTLGPSAEWGGFFNMYSMDGDDDGVKSLEISTTASAGARLKLFNAQPGRASTTAVDMYYDSINGGGTVKCQSDADNSWGSLTGRDLSFGTSYATTVYINYGGGSYFGGNMGIGVLPGSNILEIQRNSPTDPVADAWTIYSSRRWKKNIRTIESALDKVNRLRGVSFDWTSDDRHDIGMVAEEVGGVIPEIVTYEDNGVDARSIDYNRLTAVLIEAIKELKNENEELRKRIETLEQR